MLGCHETVKRRDFISLVGGAAAAWPLAARAQQAKRMPRIGILLFAQADLAVIDPFLRGLEALGYVDGKTVSLEYRDAAGKYERVPQLAEELVRLNPDVIFSFGGDLAPVIKKATASIPIVVVVSNDPVEGGLVASLGRPGGNATGVTYFLSTLGPKRLELLREVVPTAAVIALLVNPTNPVTESDMKDMQAAAGTIGQQLRILDASSERDFDTIFAALVERGAGALVIAPEVLFFGRSEQLAELTVRHAVPAIFQNREFAAAGGLMSYGGSLADTYRQAGIYTGRILKGEKPADLAVQQATKVDLIINLKTARALGLTVPFPLLGRADEVIE